MVTPKLPLAVIALMVAACGSTSPSSPGASAAGEPTPAPADAAMATPPTPPPAPQVDVATIFPDLDGFSHGEPTHYSPTNLYDYINGAAELFIRYGFEQLHSLEYGRGQGPEEQELTVDIYRHSSDNNAYGIYSRDRIRAQALTAIGSAAAYQPGALNFLKGRYYVKLSSYQLGEDDAALMASTARRVADALDGSDDLPALVSCFPSASPPVTVEYIASGYLGHGFLEAVFTADYPGAKVFIVDGSSAAAATAVLDRYLALAKKKGLTPTVARGINRFADPYHRDLGEVHARVVGRFMCGVITGDDELAGEYLRDIATKLGAVGPG